MGWLKRLRRYRVTIPASCRRGRSNFRRRYRWPHILRCALCAAEIARTARAPLSDFSLSHSRWSRREDAARRGRTDVIEDPESQFAIAKMFQKILDCGDTVAAGFANGHARTVSAAAKSRFP